MVRKPWTPTVVNNLIYFLRPLRQKPQLQIELVFLIYNLGQRSKLRDGISGDNGGIFLKEIAGGRIGRRVGRGERERESFGLQNF